MIKALLTRDRCLSVPSPRTISVDRGREHSGRPGCSVHCTVRSRRHDVELSECHIRTHGSAAIFVLESVPKDSWHCSLLHRCSKAREMQSRRARLTADSVVLVSLFTNPKPRSKETGCKQPCKDDWLSPMGHTCIIMRCRTRCPRLE